MTRLLTTNFSYLGQTYLAIASVMEQEYISPISICIPDESLHHLLPGGNLAFDAKKGLQVDANGLSAVQDLLVAVLTAVQTCPGCPTLNVNFKSLSYPIIHPYFLNAGMTLLMYLNNELIDSLQLKIAGYSNEEEDKWFVQNAIADLLEKWEERMRGHSFDLEFFLTNTVNQKLPV